MHQRRAALSFVIKAKRQRWSVEVGRFVDPTWQEERVSNGSF